MIITFSRWPRPSEGHVEFNADCPCGTSALWEQIGTGPGSVYRISCNTCAFPWRRNRG